MMIKTTLLGLSAAAALAAPALAEYPERTIELTIPAGAGGGTDTSARKLAILLEEKLGTSIAILNVGGGGGSVGASQFMQANADGYSLFATWNSPLTTVPQVQNVAYSLDSFTPIASTSQTAYTLCVKSDFPATTGEEFLAELEANPGKYTYGNDGIGGTMQLAAERVFQAKGIEAIAIPFGGAGETLQNFLGGHVDIYGGSISTVLPYVENGEAKCPLVTSASGVPALPGASGLEVLGLGDKETLLWRAILGPKGLDQAIVDKLADMIDEAVNDPTYVEFLATKGEVPNVVKGEDLGKRLQGEYDALAEVSKNLGL
ncbi:MAG: tripartite tricarboxylate transporter substrate binding protein [Sulfitobacter sp.]|jgi:tripartite-type tricarboxylate transporter receptor subunit TctC|uniref:tripartite tricarboxylate transporter substrate binding protein n=1 Tax=unclassified Sulfitobacter TaxID=196795 RepID=UPI0007C3D5F5|nr:MULTISPECIES: tripartite tricarboxylate transporter substrate binding protein [unclassified Sulfitobacter]HAC47924.1 tripartite tricarboxylate transporter substrate binding protein [Sulfitobacter sp.]KZX95168.1 Bordetella uptake protein [Sulfitobacter sp. HI0021]KZX95532.1 Bordetella uptake protein [Sulfitobacter sp. HI0027]KZY99798.1 Bordetella uptake protein [Sulfitobacter sp. HI0076]WPZ29723.1 tripartite tricarboxylate transporter substrate binding protein [Sulfitobacter sp. OXR-159]|tara:strand:- start:4774 stop:5724 length:951 start_codon:yes stop_codon:yes gene_type:complete